MIVVFGSKIPRIDPGVYIEQSAYVIGDVTIKQHSSVWFNAVIRGDIHYIKIGAYTNIQDCVVIHVTQKLYPTEIGDYVTVGHSAIIHGSKIDNNCRIGIGAIILDGAVIPEYCIVAAGSLVPPRAHYPSHSLIMGTPAKVLRKLSEKDKEMITAGAKDYAEVN